jgi:hypothetical protein
MTHKAAYTNKALSKMYTDQSPNTKRHVQEGIDRLSDERNGIFDPDIEDDDTHDLVSQKLNEVRWKEYRYLTS